MTKLWCIKNISSFFTQQDISGSFEISFVLNPITYLPAAKILASWMVRDKILALLYNQVGIKHKRLCYQKLITSLKEYRDQWTNFQNRKTNSYFLLHGISPTRPHELHLDWKDVWKNFLKKKKSISAKLIKLRSVESVITFFTTFIMHTTFNMLQVSQSSD